MEKEIKQSTKHIILVHGACHGAWSWFKVSPALRSAGYRVTVLDMAASGIDGRRITDLLSMADYSQPLLDIMGSLPEGERVILVGHSLGGVNIALAMEEFPEKIAAAVFLAAFMPDCDSPPSLPIDKFATEGWVSSWLDTEFKSYSEEEKLPTTMFFGPQFMRNKLYQLCSEEDFTLGMSLIRVSSLFLEDLRCQPPLSKARYGSVAIVYIICNQDLGIPAYYQRCMIENYPVKEVKTIDTDHMAALSAPKELCDCLMEIASSYS